MMNLGLQVKASKRNDYAQLDCDRERMVRGALSGKEYMRLVLSLLFVMTLSGCAGFAHKDNLSNQVDQREALIQVTGKGHIICYIDGRSIFGSANEKSVAPGVRDVVVTERGCKNPVRFLINASAGFIYRISPNRLSLKIFNNSMEDVDELFLDSSFSGRLLSREQYDRKIHGERYRLKSEYEKQVLLEEAAIQRRRMNLTNVRKVGAQICQTKTFSLGIARSP